MIVHVAPDLQSAARFVAAELRDRGLNCPNRLTPMMIGERACWPFVDGVAIAIGRGLGAWVLTDWHRSRSTFLTLVDSHLKEATVTFTTMETNNG